MIEYEYIKRENLLDGITSPESDFDEVITNLIFEHKLDFLHDNNEDGVRDFAQDLLVRVKNYIATEPAVDVEEVKHGEWLPDYETFVDEWERESEPVQTGWVCSLCGRQEWNKEPYCHCGAKMDGKEGAEG